ncbi:hypothetical protein EsH8_X_000362 [Colletotrichum jinshuiense]
MKPMIAAMLLTAAAVRAETYPTPRAVSPELMMAKTPQCSMPCLLEVFQSGGCKVEELADCVCTNVALQARISACVQTSCEFKDQMIAAEGSKELCRGYPVQEQRRNLCRFFLTGVPVFTIVIILLRCVARKMAGLKLWWDDWMAVLGMLILFITAGCGTAHVHLGFGLHFWNIDPGNTKPIIQAVIGLLAVILCQHIIFLFVLTFQCIPINSIWDRYIPGRCLNLTAIGYAGGSFTVAYDVILIILPIPELLKLNFSTRKKLISIFMLVLGSFATVASMIRLKYLVFFAHSFDATWDNVEVVIWSTLEMNLVLICGSLPALKPLFDKGFKMVKLISPGLWNKSRETSHGQEKSVQSSQSNQTDLSSPC